jgi:hypothetical protein
LIRRRRNASVPNARLLLLPAGIRIHRRVVIVRPFRGLLLPSTISTSASSQSFLTLFDKFLKQHKNITINLKLGDILSNHPFTIKPRLMKYG